MLRFFPVAENFFRFPFCTNWLHRKLFLFPILCNIDFYSQCEKFPFASQTRFHLFALGKTRKLLTNIILRKEFSENFFKEKAENSSDTFQMWLAGWIFLFIEFAIKFSFDFVWKLRPFSDLNKFLMKIPAFLNYFVKENGQLFSFHNERNEKFINSFGIGRCEDRLSELPDDIQLTKVDGKWKRWESFFLQARLLRIMRRNENGLRFKTMLQRKFKRPYFYRNIII